MRPEISQLRLTRFSFGGLDWKRDVGVAHVQRVEKRFMMDEGGVINIKRHLGDQGQRVFANSVIENPYVFRDQPAKRVQR